MKDLLNTCPVVTKQKNIEIIDLTNKNLFESIQVIISTSAARVCKSSAPILKYKSNIPNIEKIIKDIPVLSAVEFI